MSDATILGRFIWHELMTTDTKSAGKFFSKIIGWKTQTWPHDPSYTIFMNGKQPVAGLMLLPEPARAMGVPPNWMTYVGTPNLKDTVAHAQSLGAKILREPAQLPSVGSFAVLQDPQGAAFTAYTPEQDDSSDAPAQVGGFSWHELATTDYRAALKFYQQLFGWEDAGAQDMGEGLGVYQMFGRNGRPTGGIFTKPANMPGPAFWLPYIHVKDARRVAAEVTRARASVINGPMKVPGGDWITQGMDLQGAVFAVHSLKDPVVVSPSKPAAVKSTGGTKKTATKAVAAARRKKRPVKKAVTPARKTKGARKATRTSRPSGTAVLRKSGAKKGAAKKGAAKKGAIKRGARTRRSRR